LLELGRACPPQLDTPALESGWTRPRRSVPRGRGVRSTGGAHPGPRLHDPELLLRRQLDPRAGDQRWRRLAALLPRQRRALPDHLDRSLGSALRPTPRRLAWSPGSDPAGPARTRRQACGRHRLQDRPPRPGACAAGRLLHRLQGRAVVHDPARRLHARVGLRGSRRHAGRRQRPRPRSEPPLRTAERSARLALDHVLPRLCRVPPPPRALRCAESRLGSSLASSAAWPPAAHRGRARRSDRRRLERARRLCLWLDASGVLRARRGAVHHGPRRLGPGGADPARCLRPRGPGPTRHPAHRGRGGRRRQG